MTDIKQADRIIDARRRYTNETVTVYEDPYTRTKAEGEAVVIFVAHVDTDGALTCQVDFTDEPGVLYERVVVPKEG